jgi:type I restriction enzyme S subunit
VSRIQSLALDEIMASTSDLVDPSKFRNELFDLYSIPAFDKGKPDVIAGGDIGSTKQVVEPGDVLLSKIVPHIRRAWVVGEHRGRRLIASSEWIVFRSTKIHPKYLRHVLVENSFHAKFMRTVSGVGGSLLRARPAQVADIEILVPPLSEQKRIAAILEKADRLRSTRRYARQLSDTFLQSLFVDMFGHDDYEIKRLEEFALQERGAFVNGPFGSDLLTSELVAAGIPVIYIRDISEGYYQRTSTACITPEKAEELKVCRTEPGDVLVAKVGDPPGTAAIYPKGESVGVVTQDVIRIKLNLDLVTPEYLVSFLNSELGFTTLKPIIVEGTRSRFGFDSLQRASYSNAPAPAATEVRRHRPPFRAVARAAARSRAPSRASIPNPPPPRLQRRSVSESIKQLAGRVGGDLQKLEDLLKTSGDRKIKIRFPRGFLRRASHFRERYWFVRDNNLKRNIGYSLILSDVYRWMLNRTDLWGTPREMLIKEGVCLMGSLTESLTKDAMRGICGKNQSYSKRLIKMAELCIINDNLRAKLEWLWDYRNHEHLFLIEEWEYGHYTLKHYNNAILALRGLRDALDKYFRELDTPF